MAKWIEIGTIGMIESARIVAIGKVNSAPIRRMINETPSANILIFTGGQRRQSVLVLDSGHLVVTAMTLETLLTLLANDHPLKY